MNKISKYIFSANVQLLLALVIFVTISILNHSWRPVVGFVLTMIVVIPLFLWLHGWNDRHNNYNDYEE